jgi:TatD DNase family protein
MIASQKGRELIDAMPQDFVLTERDGPFVKLGPQSADPTSAPIVLKYLAREWHLEVDEVARAVLANLERRRVREGQVGTQSVRPRWPLLPR